MDLAMNKTKNGILGGVLMIAGCCIGAGMLGMPVVSALAGYIPSTIAMMLCCFFMAATGLLILEATLYFTHEAGLISIAGYALGKFGRIATGALFLMVFYCLMVAYTAASGELVSDMLSGLFQREVPRPFGILFSVIFIGILIYVGVKVVDHVNRVLMLGLIASYVALILMGLPSVSLQKLTYMNFGATLTAIPILLVSFGFGNLVPSLTHYLERNVSQLRLSIILGSLLPFAIYLVWNTVILSLIPDAGKMSDEVASNQIEMVTGLLKAASGSTSVMAMANAFSICAIVTSFLTCGLSCVDFIKDGLRLSNSAKNRLLLCVMVLLPPTLFAFVWPHLFLKALGYAGGFATVLLFGILPVLAVYKGRYISKIEAPYTAPGGKILLGLIFLLSLIFLSLELAQQLHLL